MATIAAVNVSVVPLLPSPVRSSSSRAAPASVLRHMRTFQGVKAHDKVMNLGVVEPIDHHFARIVKAFKSSSSSSSSRAKGGAMASTCQVDPGAGVLTYNLVSSIGGLLITTVILAAFLIWVEKSIEEAAK